MNEIVQTGPTQDERNLAMLSHLLGIFTGFIGALVIWLIKKEESAFIAEHAKEALNFQITIGIAFVVGWVLSFVLIGFLLIPLVYIANFIFCIVAAVAASKGAAYQYPVAIRLVS